ncbi:MAG TPA: glycoside hydrolase family 2 TIM barrel-domain containing protein [Planctomycetota bacterium]|nr:glycoside hydrolase family 2 TIM barrel-domain containing protein [Planctomycetota bacterium]
MYRFFSLCCFTTWFLLPSALCAEEGIFLPEHPRPDFERAEWVNLNGRWSFRFDREDAGEKEKWFEAKLDAFPRSITVPFPWGSKLSGVENEADIAWYARTIRVPADWKGKRVFLCVGAADWRTTGWIDGRALGSHRGGYTPFELELTPHVELGSEQTLVLRIDDTPHPFKLEGKQGYGQARGIWQTVYLEARGAAYLGTVHFVPEIDKGTVEVRTRLGQPAPGPVEVSIAFRTGGVPGAALTIPQGASDASVLLPVPGARLWSPEDPFLYEVDVTARSEGSEDRVRSYFGMRKVSVTRLPGLGHPWIALNNRPIYLQMALDQAYHPDGFYTFPSDEFMRDEILRSRRIGLNAIRIHVKIEIPRKLYWADRLGLLVMADVPNSWGEPDDEMRRETETALRGMVHRDFNHPSIFSWVVFNETWGLFSKGKVYAPETQEWVRSMYRLTKSLDPTRLVEDNSPCNNDHVETDINTWHAYLPGYAWRESLDQITRDTHPGSKWNFIGGRVQREEPLLNSECGNVWGYEGSTGDVDYSWDYHIMMNEFRRHPKVCGWLYTEHHDVINEWNGYFRFDRSPKATGLSELVPGMSLKDLHAPFYIAPGSELCADAEPGQSVEVPLWASFLADTAPASELLLRAELSGWDDLGRRETYWTSSRKVPFSPWLSREIDPLAVPMPAKRAVAVLSLTLDDGSGIILHRNFTTFNVTRGAAARDEVIAGEGRETRVLRFAPASHHEAKWSLGSWEVLDGLKACGAGAGHFEYRIPWPRGLDASKVSSASFRAELSAKRLLGKDRKSAGKQEGDFMLGKGTLDPGLNPNAYPMTDSVRDPSAVRVRVNGVPAGVFDLDDDPADHRGILSWRFQKRDKRLREAGSYGYLVGTTVPRSAIEAAAKAGEIIVRLEVDSSLPGGLAVYGERFGRYPLDPTLRLVLER